MIVAIRLEAVSLLHLAWPRSTHRGVTRMFFLILLCSLVVPRTAWGAHEAGHERLASAYVVHTHHGDHIHEHAPANADPNDVVDVREKSAPTNGGVSPEGLTHEHTPSAPSSSALLLPSGIDLSTMKGADRQHLVARYDGNPLQRPEFLLRPPRTA